MLRVRVTHTYPKPFTHFIVHNSFSYTRTMSDLVTAAITSVADAAARKQSYFKKLSYAAGRERQLLTQAAKFGSLVRAGTAALASGDLEQALRVDGLLTITPAGRVKLADAASFNAARPAQLCDFLAAARPPPTKTLVRRRAIVDLSLDEEGAGDEESAPRPSKRSLVLRD
jgi:hypothetical protein